MIQTDVLNFTTRTPLLISVDRFKVDQQEVCASLLINGCRVEIGYTDTKASERTLWSHLWLLLSVGLTALRFDIEEKLRGFNKTNVRSEFLAWAEKNFDWGLTSLS